MLSRPGIYCPTRWPHICPMGDEHGLLVPVRTGQGNPTSLHLKILSTLLHYRNVPCLICGFSKSRIGFHPWSSFFFFFLNYKLSRNWGKRWHGIVSKTTLLLSNELQSFFSQVISCIVSDILFGTKNWTVNKIVGIKHTHRKTNLSPLLLSLVPPSFSPTLSLLRFGQQWNDVTTRAHIMRP